MISEQIERTKALFHEKLGVRAVDLMRTTAKAKSRIPRRIYAQAMVLARAEPLAAHPKLRLTLDGTALGVAADEVQSYLDGIDVADRRKGWLLGVMGGLVFNLILFGVLLVVVLMWRGYL